MSNGFETTSHYVLRQILDEIILVPVSPLAREKNRMLVLNPSAAFFYSAIKEGKSFDEIKSSAIDAFSDLTAETFQADFSEFAQEMEKLEAIRAQPSKD